MATRWVLSELHQNASHRVLYSGRSFSRCDRPSNQSCVLGNKYHHGNDTDNDVSDDVYNTCRTYDDGSVTWYYLHVRRLINVSVVRLEFDSENEAESESESALDDTVPSCTNVSLSIQPFGTVPFHNRDDNVMLRRMYKKIKDVRFDTFHISGMGSPLFFFKIITHKMSIFDIKVSAVIVCCRPTVIRKEAVFILCL